MNELRRNGKRTREQLTFSETYLILDNLRKYDFDLVGFYVTFNQYIDRRNYEGKAENSLIFPNNESLYKAFNISRNKFYRLLKLSYECGLVDIEKGENNRNIYILNDAIPLEPLKKIKNWEDRLENINKLSEEKSNDKIEDDIKFEDRDEEENKNKIDVEDDENYQNLSYEMSYPKKGQPKQGQPVVPKRDNRLSQIGTTLHPKTGQPVGTDFFDEINVLGAFNNAPNNTKDLIDLSSNNQSVCQSIYNYNICDSKIKGVTDGLIDNYCNKILEKCEVHYIDEQYRNAVVYAIKLLCLDIENKKRIRIGENLIPTEIVRKDLRKLNFFVIEHAINKFKEASREKEIRNTISYLKSCIYNSIHEMNIDIDSELRYMGLI